MCLQINDVMRKEDRSWNIRRLNTTFLTFMKKLEDEVRIRSADCILVHDQVQLSQ